MITLTATKFMLIIGIVVLISAFLGTSAGGALLMYYFRYKKGMHLINQMVSIDEISNSLEQEDEEEMDDFEDSDNEELNVTD